jgi:hypothetical protein
MLKYYIRYYALRACFALCATAAAVSVLALSVILTAVALKVLGVT